MTKKISKLTCLILLTVIVVVLSVAPAAAQKEDTPRISVSPGKLEFGSVSVGETKTKSVKIRNGGKADLELVTIDLCGGTSAEFGVSSVAPTILTPKQSVRFDVEYSPTDSGVDRGCVEITSDDPKHPSVEISVRGRGEDDEPETDGPDIDLQPDSVDFGQVLVGGSRTVSVRVKNEGSAPLEEVMVGRCDGTSEEFSWAPTDMFSVPPDDNVKVDVIYSPTEVGADEGCLAIVSNDPDENPAVLQVAGEGVESTAGAVDFDIFDFKVRRKVRLGSAQTVNPQLWVKSEGLLDDPRPAIVIGMQGEAVVYDEQKMVSDRGGNQGKTKYRFPPFAPDAPGEIVWMAFIDDDDSDIDEAMAVTQVVGQSTPSVGVDLDPSKLKATKQVSLADGRSIRVRAWVKNNGTVDEARPMTLTGTQGGVEIYSVTVDVSDVPGDGAATRYDLGSVTPTAAGDILWRVTIADDDADDDVMSAVTRVGP